MTSPLNKIDLSWDLVKKVLEAPHPASEVYKSGSGFIGCNHFKQVNEILAQQNKKLINF